MIRGVPGLEIGSLYVGVQLYLYVGLYCRGVFLGLVVVSGENSKWSLVSDTSK